MGGSFDYVFTHVPLQIVGKIGADGLQEDLNFFHQKQAGKCPHR